MGSLICASQRDFNCSMSNRGQVLSNFRLASWRWCLPCLWCIRGSGCVIWGFHRRVYEILILLGCYAAFIGSYRHLGTTYSSHLQGSGLLNALRWNKYLVPKCRCFVWSQKCEGGFQVLTSSVKLSKFRLPHTTFPRLMWFWPCIVVNMWK